MGFRFPVRRSTLAEANESRDWCIYAELARRLMRHAHKLYAQESLGMELVQAASRGCGAAFLKVHAAWTASTFDHARRNGARDLDANPGMESVRPLD